MECAIVFDWEVNGEPADIMGMELTKDIILVRHGYVLLEHQRKGIASQPFNHIMQLFSGTVHRPHTGMKVSR